MEPWGVDQKSTKDAVEPLSQVEVQRSGDARFGTRKWRKARVALIVAGTLALVAGGTLHEWRKAAAPKVSGSIQREEKGVLGKFADNLREGASLLGGAKSDSAKNIAASKTTKMSGAPLSLPLFFEENHGQTDPQVKFLARSGGYTLFVTPTETVFAGAHTRAPLGGPTHANPAEVNSPELGTLRMKLLQSNPGPGISGVNELPGKVNYLIGNNPRDWHTGVPLYEEVRSREVYPGIDLVFHGDQQRLEYDFQVAPGADPGRIRFKVTGAEKIAVDENGDLVLRTGKNEFRMRKPVVYQQDGERRKPVDGGFTLQAGKLVAFHLGAYDKKKTLVIDPTIIFASFLGAAGQELPAGIGLDTTNPGALKLYLSGSTTDVASFTETNTKIGNTTGAGAYAFVAKIDPTTTGSASLDFLTFIGGNLVFTGGTAPCENLATDLKLDQSGGAGQVEPVLLGNTNCRDFPITVGGTTTGTDDLFLTRLTPSGAAIDGSTLFGGNGSAGLTYGGGASLFVNPEGSIVLSGDTTSTDFATTANAYSVSFNNGTPGGFDDCFIGKLDRAFNILYLTYLNVGLNSTSGNPAGCGVGAVDPAGKIYFGGNIYSATAFNLANGGAGANGFEKTFVGTPGTTPNAFVGVLDPSLSGLNQLTYASYIAGGGGTNVQAGAVDVTHGIAALVGTTISNSTTNAPDIPLLNAFQSTNNSPVGVGTGFITVIDTAKTGAASLVASTYYGGSTGSGSSSVRSVAIDSVPGNSPTQRIVVGGQTTATNFPTMNPLQASLVGSQNAFVSVLSVPSPGNTFNMAQLFSTYLGGGATATGQGESIRALLTDSNHQVYALGRTASANFFGNTVPATSVNGFQTTCASCGGGTPVADLAIFVLTPQSGTNVPDLTVSKSHSGSFSQGQSGAQFSITVTNSGAGTTVGTVTLADSLPSSLTATAMTGTGWTCSISTLICTRADGLAGGTSYPVITLTVNVAGNAPPSVTNTVTVSGGSETNTANNTASDVAAITSSVGACTNNYSGLTNGSWGTATNWSSGAVPVSTDVVCIPTGITVLVNTGLAAANQTISGLNSSGTITFSSGPLSVTNNSVANAINMNGGTLAFNGQLTISGPLAVTGGNFGGTGEIDANGGFTWSGGTICSTITGVSCATGANATLNANLGITFPASSSVVLSSRTLNNNGTTTWSGANGSIDMVNGAVINNPASRVWNYANDSGLVFGGGTAVAFNNLGTFEKTGGTVTSTIGVNFNNSGTVLGNSGTLSFSGGGSCGSSCPGTFTAAAPGTIAFTAGVFSQSGPINGSGTVNFNGGTMNFGSGVEIISATTINISAGVLGGAAPGVLNFETRLNWTGGTMCSSLSGASCIVGINGTTNANAGINFPASSSVVLSARTLNNNGTATWSGVNGSVDMVNGAVINNGASSVWNYTNDSSLVFGGGSAVTFNNGGTFEKTAGTATTTIGINFNNTGTVLGNSGTLSFTGGGACGSTCSGTFTATTPGIISFAANVFGQSGPINGTGTVNFNGGAVNFGTGTETITTATVNFSSGNLGGAAPGILNFATLLNWTGGTMCSSLTGASCVLGTNATTNANAGINFPASSSVVLSDRTLNNNATATWSGANGSVDMVNGAVINNPLNSVWNYTNDSSLVFGGGTAVTFNNGGTFEKTAGTATTTIGINFNNSGTVLGNSGTLTFTGGGTCGSTCSGTFTATTPGILSFTANVFGQSGPINGTGTVNFNGGTVNFGTGTETITTATVNFSAGNLGGAAPGILNFATLLNWTGGTMCSSLTGASCIVGTNATTNANAGINFPASSSVVLSDRTLNNNATATWSGANGALDMINGAILNNAVTGVWNYTNDSTIVFGGGAAVSVNNAGTFEKTAGTATTTIGINFNNTGSVLGNSGTLSFSGGGNCGSTCSGSFAAGAGGAISFPSGTYSVSGPFNGAGTVNFNGGTLNLTGTYGVTGPTNVSAGTVNLNEATPLTIASALNFTGGTIAGSTSTLNLAGLLTWSGGTLALPGTTNATGNIAFPNVGSMILSLGVLNTPGSVTFAAGGSGSGFFQENGAVVNNTGTWNLQGDDSVNYNGGTATTFNNNAGGIFEKTGGTTSSTVGVAFNNNGTVTDGTTSGSATLNFSSGLCSSPTSCTGNGAWNVLAGYTLAFNSGIYSPSGTFSGAGTMNFVGATVNFSGPYGVTGPNNISAGAVNFNEASPVTIAGPVNFTGGTIAGSTSTLNLPGLFTWSAGTLGLPGTTNATGGIAFPSAGAMVQNGGILNTSSPVTFAAGGSGSSFLQANAAVVNNTSTWNLQGDDFVTYNGGTATAFNNNSSGIFEKTGGTGTSQVSTGFINNGSVTVGTTPGSGTMVFSIGVCSPTAPCTGSGSWNVLTGYTLSFLSGNYNLSGPLNVAGTLNFGGAAMTLTGAYGVTGPTNFSAGIVNFNEATPVTIAGPVNFTGGTIAGSTSTLNLPGLFTWSAGTLGLPGTTNATGNIAFPNAGAMVQNGGILNTSGTVTFAAGGSGSSFLQSNGAVLNNTGTWNIQGDDFVTYNGGTATAFNNNAGGIFEKTGGTTLTQVSTSFSNAGTVLANIANLFFTNTFMQTAGRTTLGGGSVQTLSSHPLLIQGGSLTGTGTVTGDVTNTGGSVAPGSTTAAGALSLSGSGLGVYGQSATGAFNVKIGGTAAGQFDTLTMSGAATLGGPLNVSLLNSFSPALGNTFTILTAASVTGTFSTTNFPALSAGLGWHVTYNATNVVLTVVSVSSPVANLNPGSVTFPNTIVNTAAAIQKVQLQNTGTSALTITSIVPTGTDAANYSYTPDAVQPCPMSPATLANGASCLLDIGFLPLSAGTHNNAGITVTDDSGNVVGSTQTVALSGTGIVLSSIAVTPASPTIAKGNTQQFTATGTFSDTSTQNLTSTVTWASATTAVATINATGLAQGVSPGTSNITAKQGAVTSPAAVLTVTGATHFAVSAPSTATAGNAITVTVTAQDQFNSTVPGYAGTVHFTSSDGAAVLPANSTLTNGSGSFQVTLKTLGSQTVTATDTVTATITGTSNSVTVGSGLATHFQVSVPGIATVGVATSVSVSALDQFNNVVTTYAGTVHFTSTDATAVLPANTTLTSGAGTFPVTFKTAGSQTVTATDTVTATITGTSNADLVSTGTATHLLLAASPSVTAGSAFPIAVEALDQFNNIVTTYTGTVHFTSTDGAAVLPANSTLTNGVGSFQVTLKTTGSQTITGTDTVTATITGTSNAITVSSTTATHFLVTAPPSASAGTAVSVSVVALDQFNNLVTGYTGTVHFTSTDAAAVLPANSILTSGVGAFQVTLKTAGSQTVTATDTVTSTINGISNAITVGPITATHLLISAPGAATAGAPFNIIVTALDQFSNIATGYAGTVHFTSTDGAAVLPANVTLINGTNTLSVTLKTLGSQTITGTDTVTATITGTSNTVSVSSGVATHFVVSAPGAATAGTAISVSVTALDSLSNIATGYAGTVHFTSTDGAATLPANSILASGTGTFQVTLKTAGSQTVTATDTVNGTITGTTGAIVVTAVLQTITVAPTSASVAAGLTQAFTATGHFSDGTSGAVSVNWSSANTAIATINSSGVATGVSAGGPITITATSTANAAISGTAQLTVTAAVLQTITVAPSSASVAAGLTQPFTATGHFSDGTAGAVSVNWASSNTGIATINSSGVATGVAAGGPVTITATSTTNATISGTAQLTVTAAGPTLQTISVTPANPTLATNATQAFIAIGHFSDGTLQNLTSSATWASATTTVATINAAGVATGVGPGTSTISATLGAVSGTTVLTVTATTAHAYVGDSVSATCCLDVIDITTNQIVKQIPITTINEPLAVTPDQSRVYVPDNVGSVLDVIDTTTNTLVNTISVGNGTTAVVINPNGQFGYVSDLNDANVVVFNVATGTVVATVPIGFSAGWISITPDGAFVYAASGSDGRVAVINTSTNTLSTTITLSTPPGQPAVGCVSGPTFNPAGTLGYFSLLCSGNTLNGNTIDVLSIPSNTLVAAISVGAGPFQSAISPDGSRLYSANAVANTVSVINTATNAVIATVPMPGHSQSIAVTPDGAHVYVASPNAATVSVIQTSTNTVSASIPTTAPFGIVIASPPAASAATTLTLTPPNLLFGPQVDGTQSTTQTISVKNPGATPVTLTSIFLSGPNIGDFRLINGCPTPPATLGAGGSCNLQISSFPTTNGQREALVTINSTNGVAASTQSAPLSGIGISLVSIAVTPVNASVIATNTVQFTATGTYSNNSTQNLTGSVIWASSSTGIATINASGLATGVAAGGPITITATSGNIFGTTQLTVNPLAVTFPLNVTLIGTGTGSVTDNLGSINCVNTAGVISGTCSASYPSGTVVSLTATPTQPSTFGGYLGACSGTGACSVTMNSAQSVTASFVPPPQALPVSFAPGTDVSAQAAYDCPSNPNPTPANPCLDPNAHAAAFTIGQVLTPFTLTVVATEVPPTNGDGICPNGLTPTQDFDCRFTSFFTFQTKANGDAIVPLCDPYANGNCVVYSVFFQNPGQEPDPSMYVGPVNWNITYNNGTFVPPAPWTGSTPRLYYDPSGFVVPNSPYGTDCTAPMLIGSPGVPTSPAIFCQFVFDITTIFDASKKVDPLIGGKTKVFSDAVVAFPPNFAPVVTVTTTPDAATVTAGSPIGFTITVSNSALAVANNVSLNTPLPGGANVNWTISPAFAGSGTCAITGAQGSQVLNCAFGTLPQSASASLHILSASSAAGTAISPSTVNVGPQQLLSIGSIVVQPIPVTFSGLAASQTIPVGTSSVTLAGVIGNGTQFAPSGETVSITINGNKQTATVGSNGAFSIQFPTATIPVSGTAYSITYSYAGDSLLSAASNNTTTLAVTAVVGTLPLNVTLIGSGTGSVTDNLGSINCVNTAGVTSGTCSANYPSGTVVVLTPTATQPSTFGGYLGACSGTGACSVTMNSAQLVTASFVPPPQALPLPFTPGTNVSGQVAFDCPSNPNPTPANPCLDPNAHSAAFTIGQVLTPFTLTVVSTEVPPTNGDGICENGRTPGQDLDCRFGSFFTFQTKANGDRIVPLCAPYANGNCVVYSVFFQNPGQEPDPSMYVGPVSWNITYNNGTFVPPAPWTGSTPRLYYDPSGFVVPNSPYGTDCTTPMLIGSPGVPTSPAIFCQFVFDITTIFDASKKVDPLIGGKTKVFSDAVVAFPPNFAPVVTVTTTPDAATVTAGSPIGFTITVSNSAAAVANNVSLNTPLPGGTNVSWTISPAFAGPGTCAITGAQGSQVLNCAFGTLAQSASVSLHILSASSAVGTAISPSTINVGPQQLLSIGSIVVQPIPVTFSGLTASQTIPAGTSSVTLGGVIGNGTQFAPSGETVSITINATVATATVGSNGTFSLQFPTANIPASTTAYAITYSYAGDSLLSSATNSSTTLTARGGGEPQISAKTIGSGTSNGNFFVDLQFTNTGNGVARNLKLNGLTFKTLLGRGNVTLNTARSPKLPDNLGSFNVGASVTVRLYLNAPPGVPRFLMSETGTVGDITGKTFSYSAAETVSATGRDRDPGSGDDHLQ